MQQLSLQKMSLRKLSKKEKTSLIEKHSDFRRNFSLILSKR